MLIADRKMTVDQAVRAVEGYAERYPKTLEVYDGLGDNGYRDPAPHHVTVGDIGRLVIINAMLKANDVGALLDVDAHQAFASVPVDASLENATYGEALWNDATALFDLFGSIKGVDRAKRSKLLHMKRPHLFFVADSVTSAAYSGVAAELAAARGDGSKGFWEAAQRDIQQVEFADVMSSLESRTVPALPGSPSLGSLSRLRVLDIVCWSAT